MVKVKAHKRNLFSSNNIAYAITRTSNLINKRYNIKGDFSWMILKNKNLKVKFELVDGSVGQGLVYFDPTENKYAGVELPNGEIVYI